MSEAEKKNFAVVTYQIVVYEDQIPPGFHELAPEVQDKLVQAIAAQDLKKIIGFTYSDYVILFIQVALFALWGVYFLKQ